MIQQETRIVWIAAFIQLINIIDFMMVMPLGPDISKDLPITNSDIGIICGFYTLAVGFSSLVCAKFLDNFDRKKVALVAVLGLSLATLTAPFCWDLKTLTGARILAGLFGGPAAAIAFSMACDAVPPERRGKAMAIVMGTFSVSAIAAIPFGLELAERGSWRTPFYALSSLGLLVFGLIFQFTPSMRNHFEKQGPTAFSDRTVNQQKIHFGLHDDDNSHDLVIRPDPEHFRIFSDESGVSALIPWVPVPYRRNLQLYPDTDRRPDVR